MDAEDLMRRAIQRTREGIALGATPFGCAIVLGDEVVALEHNRVWLTTDITAHAEIVALRAACASRKQIHFPGAIVATTTEPCPMCMAALHWARVDTVYYGATIADATAAGFNELNIAATDMVRLGGSSVKLSGGILADECAALFDEWKTSGKSRAY